MDGKVDVANERIKKWISVDDEIGSIVSFDIRAFGMIQCDLDDGGRLLPRGPALPDSVRPPVRRSVCSQVRLLSQVPIDPRERESQVVLHKRPTAVRPVLESSASMQIHAATLDSLCVLIVSSVFVLFVFATVLLPLSPQFGSVCRESSSTIRLRKICTSLSIVCPVPKCLYCAA